MHTHINGIINKIHINKWEYLCRWHLSMHSGTSFTGLCVWEPFVSIKRATGSWSMNDDSSSLSPYLWSLSWTKTLMFIKPTSKQHKNLRPDLENVNSSRGVNVEEIIKTHIALHVTTALSKALYLIRVLMTVWLTEGPLAKGLWSLRKEKQEVYSLLGFLPSLAIESNNTVHWT